METLEANIFAISQSCNLVLNKFFVEPVNTTIPSFIKIADVKWEALL